MAAADILARTEACFAELEPSVLAFIPEPDRFGRLHRELGSLEARYPAAGDRPPLFGVLAGVKDIFHVDGFATRAGSRLPAEALHGQEAESVKRLKDAGALILGKTVTTEFAYFSPGPTRNPHNPEHTPGGSSSGSAAAVGAGLCPVALGTQTIGSIIRPASFCGVVGFKPGYDRISRAGVIPLAPSLDHVGFFTPDVAGATRAARALYNDWHEPAGSSKKPVLGIPDGAYLQSASEEGLAHFEGTCKALGKDYQLLRLPAVPDFQEIRARHDVILSAEAAQVHGEWFEKYGNLYSPKFTDLIQRGRRVTDSQLRTALGARDHFREDMARTMSDYDIDLWICPATIGPAPKGLDSTGDPVMNLPWTQIGFPAINLPAGKNGEGLPLGLQVIGKRDADEELLTWAAGLEKALARR
jgi:Asp-tRNA(Asn)/Glu-tRNA(Gln) amidotransferase A subunit family amidase